MAYSINFKTASSHQLEKALCQRIEEIRLARNITQADLAEKSGISLRTLRRMIKGEGVSFDTFLRVLSELGIQHNLEMLLPDPTVRPMERAMTGRERKRARSTAKPEAPKNWAWGDEPQ